MDIRILVLLVTLTAADGQFYEDKRCRCICPSFAALLNTTLTVADRRVYTSNVPPSKCNCEGVILKIVGKELKGHEQEFCPRCECKYQTRNTTIIMVVVIMLLWTLTLLSGYMGFLMCLDPLINKSKVKFHHDKDADSEEARNLLLQDLED